MRFFRKWHFCFVADPKSDTTMYKYRRGFQKLMLHVSKSNMLHHPNPIQRAENSSILFLWCHLSVRAPLEIASCAHTHLSQSGAATLALPLFFTSMVQNQKWLVSLTWTERNHERDNSYGEQNIIYLISEGPESNLSLPRKTLFHPDLRPS